MPINYVIGIGGTGARVVEAIVHCCATGFGPMDPLNIFLVDADEGNGNLTRTKDLITAYQDCHRIYRSQMEMPQALFRTEIRTSEALTWGILDKTDATLDSYMIYDSLTDDLKDFVGLLFSPEERETRLNEGFRGHPSIGAAVMANAEEKGPWQSFWQSVSNAQGEGSVRVFLVGSVFGGTGAAGIPTFASPDMLKRNPKAKLKEPGASKIRLGAALVLPYFVVDMDAEATQVAETEMCVTPADFPIATKVALEYYDTKQLAFDDIYLVGDDAGRKVGDFHAGARLQSNRPHYIELITALSAFDFFRSPPGPAKEARYFLAGRDSTVIDWDGLPVSRDETRLVELQRNLKHALVSMSAFAYGLATYGAAIFEADPISLRETWYRDRFALKPTLKGRDKAFIDDASRDELRVVKKYSEEFLIWLAQLDGDDGRLALIRGDKLGVRLESTGAAFNPEPDQGNGKLPIFLKSESRAGVEEPASRSPKPDDLLLVLKDQAGSDLNASASAQFIDLFYRASVRFTESELRVTTLGTEV